MTRYTASRTQALAFYYFDFTNDVKTKTLSCLRSIILQLAEHTADTTSLQALQRVYAMGTPPIQEFLEVLKTMLCTHSRVYIIVDALDECTDQEELFDLLISIRDWKLECLSILTTSRDEPDIRECVQPAPGQEIRLCNSTIDNDLRLFIVETLQKDKKLQAWSDIVPEIEKALTNGAHGMFRWVDCQLQSLRECPSRAEARKALQNLPETLDKTYERMLRNIRPNLRHYAVRLLQWLCIADEAVDLDHIMDAFATSIGEEPHLDPDARFVSSDKILALCPGLVVKRIIRFGEQVSQDTVQIAHYSVKEYLVSNRLPIAPDPLYIFRIQQPFANLAMAKTCLVYLIFEPHDFYTPFRQVAVEEWPKFFSNAKKDLQLMELAISYLTRKNGYTREGDIHAAMYFAIKNRLRDIETWLVDHHRPDMDPSLVLLTKCKFASIHSLDFVGFWIAQGADVNARITKRLPVLCSLCPPGSTPLHTAASGGKVALAKLLLEHGASVKAENHDGLTPLQVAFEKPSFLDYDLVKLLWFDGVQGRSDSSGSSLLHQVARIELDSGETRAMLLGETVAWLINHGVDPLSKNAKGRTPLLEAARSNNPVAIKALYAATGRSTEYGGCLFAFFEYSWLREPTLSTAQLLLEIDPDPFRQYSNGSGLLPFLLHDAMHDNYPELGFGYDAFFLKYDEDPAHTKLDLYMSFFEAIMKDFPSDISAIIRWLTIEIVKFRGPEFLGVDSWRAALDFVSYCLVQELGYRKRESIINNLSRQIHILLEKREIFGVGIKELYRLLLCTVLDRGPLAKLVISQEPADTAFGLSDESPNVPWSTDPNWLRDSFVGLIVHREIHPDTRNEDDDAALWNAITLESDGGRECATTRLLMKRLLLKRACDINHRSREGLTLLAGVVAYQPYCMWGVECEVLKPCLDAGCDTNIQDDAGRTPLMIACYRGFENFAEILLNAGCDANLQDREGGTPITDIVTDNCLYHNGLLEREDIVTEESLYYNDLWKQRFSPVGGHTALMYAVILERIEIVELLLKHGCDTKLRNTQGQTALDLARQIDEGWIITIIKRHEKAQESGHGESAQGN